jgi:hypothetical protein
MQNRITNIPDYKNYSKDIDFTTKRNYKRVDETYSIPSLIAF